MTAMFNVDEPAMPAPTGESDRVVSVSPVAPNGGHAGCGKGLFDGLNQRVALAGGLRRSVALTELPDHHAPQVAVACVADFRLASMFIVVGNEHVAG